MARGYVQQVEDGGPHVGTSHGFPTFALAYCSLLEPHVELLQGVTHMYACVLRMYASVAPRLQQDLTYVMRDSRAGLPLLLFRAVPWPLLCHGLRSCWCFENNSSLPTCTRQILQPNMYPWFLLGCRQICTAR